MKNNNHYFFIIISLIIEIITFVLVFFLYFPAITLCFGVILLLIGLVQLIPENLKPHKNID